MSVRNEEIKLYGVSGTSTFDFTYSSFSENMILIDTFVDGSGERNIFKKIETAEYPHSLAVYNKETEEEEITVSFTAILYAYSFEGIKDKIRDLNRYLMSGGFLSVIPRGTRGARVHPILIKYIPSKNLISMATPLLSMDEEVQQNSKTPGWSDNDYTHAIEVNVTLETEAFSATDPPFLDNHSPEGGSDIQTFTNNFANYTSGSTKNYVTISDGRFLGDFIAPSLTLTAKDDGGRMDEFTLSVMVDDDSETFLPLSTLTVSSTSTSTYPHPFTSFSTGTIPSFGGSAGSFDIYDAFQPDSYLNYGIYTPSFLVYCDDSTDAESTWSIEIRPYYRPGGENTNIYDTPVTMEYSAYGENSNWLILPDAKVPNFFGELSYLQPYGVQVLVERLTGSGTLYFDALQMTRVDFFSRHYKVAEHYYGPAIASEYEIGIITTTSGTVSLQHITSLVASSYTNRDFTYRTLSGTSGTDFDDLVNPKAFITSGHELRRMVLPNIYPEGYRLCITNSLKNHSAFAPSTFERTSLEITLRYRHGGSYPLEAF